MPPGTRRQISQSGQSRLGGQLSRRPLSIYINVKQRAETFMMRQVARWCDAKKNLNVKIPKKSLPEKFEKNFAKLFFLTEFFYRSFFPIFRQLVVLSMMVFPHFSLHINGFTGLHLPSPHSTPPSIGFARATHMRWISYSLRKMKPHVRTHAQEASRVIHSFNQKGFHLALLKIFFHSIGFAITIPMMNYHWMAFNFISLSFWEPIPIDWEPLLSGGGKWVVEPPIFNRSTDIE